ncbi:MAG: sigma 54-interacting transcriptional regulator [Gammaproteobacteria bacterium]|nr:sigma 54-interacting transcriptional regulator [Gammaproteobacteria bacterium]MDH5727610.1 sigma 54-interacting transcriptional regulator [Gammaproteobacteria bacterium]
MQLQIKNPISVIEELLSASIDMAAESHLPQLLDRILKTVCELTRADAALIALLDGTKSGLNIEAFYCEHLEARRNDYQTIPLNINGSRNDSNVAVHCAYTGEIISIDDIYAYSGFDFSNLYEFDRLTGYETQSLMTVPMVDHQGFIVGVLQLLNAQNQNKTRVIDFSPSCEQLAIGFAAQAAVVIVNMQLKKENERLIAVLNQTNEALEEENKRLREKIEGSFDFSQIVGDGSAMQSVFNLMRKVVNSDATVLVRGETGTGKELIAQAIHFNSHRKTKEFVAQNCAALPENLLESELFGYKKGAFSGANTDKKGLFELADGGTLFLDEIGDMPLSLQAKLLRVLQEKEIRPLGSTQTKKVNVRVVAATHKNLKQDVTEGKFREDLYYRLSIFPIDLPALRERKEDLPALIKYFMDNFIEKYQKQVLGLSPKVLDLLSQYHYPGNIRELRNIVERAVLLCEDNSNIIVEFLPEEIFDRRNNNKTHHKAVARKLRGSLKSLVEHFEAEVIEEKLKENQWNQSKTAEALLVARRTLIEKINRYRISKQ